MSRFSDKSRILLLGPVPPPMGGIARYCLDILSSELTERFSIDFFDVTIPSSLRPRNYTEGKGRYLFLRDGIVSLLRQVCFALINYLKYNKQLREGQIRLIHLISCTGMGFWRNACFAYLAKKHSVRVLWHMVGEIDVFWKNGAKLKRFFIERSLNLADIIVVQSEGLKKITQTITVKTVVAVYNGVRVEDFRPADGYAHSNPAENLTRITTLGVLGQRKGYFDLIQLAADLRNEMNSLPFIFIGGGDVEKFRSLVRERGLENVVEVTGQVGDTERIRILKKSDIFLLPTYAEGQPISILEAMAAGLPVISTTVGSIPEIIKLENGRLVHPGDLTSLRKMLIEFVQDTELRKKVGARNAEEAEKKYDLQRVMREIGGIYEKMLSI